MLTNMLNLNQPLFIHQRYMKLFVYFTYLILLTLHNNTLILMLSYDSQNIVDETVQEDSHESHGKAGQSSPTSNIACSASTVDANMDKALHGIKIAMNYAETTPVKSVQCFNSENSSSPKSGKPFPYYDCLFLHLLSILLNSVFEIYRPILYYHTHIYSVLTYLLYVFKIQQCLNILIILSLLSYKNLFPLIGSEILYFSFECAVQLLHLGSLCKFVHV